MLWNRVKVAKVLGFLGAVASGVAVAIAGNIPEGIGIILASLSSAGFNSVQEG